jgi:transposase
MRLAEKHSHRTIADSVHVSPATVGDYLGRARAAGLTWPLKPELDDDDALERLLFPPGGSAPGARVQPEWSEVHRELKRCRHLTLMVLWEEYKTATPDGYQYSRYCELYRAWLGSLSISMRQEYPAGKWTFVDYAGDTVPVYDAASGEVRAAQIFVSVLGASSYTYAEATWTQQLHDWCGSHVRMWDFYEGVTECTRPDNLKSGVSKACRYEPDLNPTYQALAAHYATAVVPARARKPKDKAKAEQSVLLVERWILARLRHRTFLSLVALNEALHGLLADLNSRRFRKLPGTRRSWYEEVDRPALKPLPAERYEYAEWSRVRANIDYHVEVDHHLYSVPWQLRRQELDTRSTATTVEVFHRNKRVASHVRSFGRTGPKTVPEHMPSTHREFHDWSPMRFLDWAKEFGPSTVKVVETILDGKTHPEQAYRACMGILRLGKQDKPRLEAACARVAAMHSFSYGSVKRVLEGGLDRKPRPTAPLVTRLPRDHDNVRGAHYYDGAVTAPEGKVN